MDTSLDTILARIPSLGAEDVRVLHAAWDGGDAGVRRRAWQHGKRLLEEQGSEETYQVASDLVRRWVNDSRSATSHTNSLAFGTLPSFIEQDRLDQRIAAAPALLDAILAALVGDDLAPEEQEELAAPWLEAMGTPAPVADEGPGGSGTAGG
ncbi:MAG: hypothetical protein ABWZ82_05420 [Candidatus Limnocylindrales bacterium]